MGWLNISPDINEHYLNIWLDNHSVLSKQLGHIWSVTTGTYNHDLIDLIQNWTFLHHLDEFRARCPDASSHDPWSKITSIWTLFLVKNKFTDFSGHSCDRLVTCPGVPHLSPASAGISSSPEAGKQRDGRTAPTPSARISCRNFRSDELIPSRPISSKHPCVTRLFLFCYVCL